MDITSLRRKLQKFGQEHLLDFWDQLTDDQKHILYNDVNSIDLSQITAAYQSTQTAQTDADGREIDDELLEPLPEDIQGGINKSTPDQLEYFRSKGFTLISEGKVAVLLLAGGQGTRLGVNYPKGMYNVGLPSQKTLYQLQAERIKKLQDLVYESTGVFSTIPWFIMTSEHTKEPTQEFFENHKYFGLSKEKIIIFEQHTLPCFTFNGKIILEKPYRIARSPDGNGGLYKALRTCGILQEMASLRIKYLHVYCVDNILVKMADPIFIGYCVEKNAEAAAKVCVKACPTEAVGIICKVNGRYQVVEYSEVPLRVAEQQNPDGRLTFSAGNICNHFFTLNFLTKVSNEDKLKYHVAKKKISFTNTLGNHVKPEKANGIKLEKFVFDVFQYTNQFVVWEVEREDEFSPLKNGDEAEKDTPTTARHSLYNLHLRYIQSSGGSVKQTSNADPPLKNGHQTNGICNGHKENHDTPICEISPLVSYDGEGLEELVNGKTFTFPLLLKAGSEMEIKKLDSNGVNFENGC